MTGCNLAESSKEGYGSKMTVLPVVMMMIMMAIAMKKKMMMMMMYVLCFHL
jgi:hypothetical protein